MKKLTMLVDFKVLIVISLTVVLGFGISALGTCQSKDQIHFYADVCDNIKTNSTFPNSYFCKNVRFL